MIRLRSLLRFAPSIVPPEMARVFFAVRQTLGHINVSIAEVAKSLPNDVLEEMNCSVKDFCISYPEHFVVSHIAGKPVVRLTRVESVKPAPAQPCFAFPHAELGSVPKPPAQENSPPGQCYSRLGAAEEVALKPLVKDIPNTLVSVAAVARHRGMSVESTLASLEPAFGVLDLVGVKDDAQTCDAAAIRDSNFKVSNAFVALLPIYEHLHKGNDTSHDLEAMYHDDVAKDHDAYRIARLLKVSQYTPVSDIIAAGTSLTSMPPLLVLLSYPHLFAFQTVTREAVKFVLNEKYIPSDANEHSLEELQQQLEQVEMEYRSTKRATKKLKTAKENRIRVCLVSRIKYLRRELQRRCQPSPYVDPNVAAMCLFDSLPADTFIPVAECEGVLPLECQAVVTINKKWILRFPNLFTLFQHDPPRYSVQRANLPRPNEAEYSQMSEQEIVQAILAAQLRLNPKNRNPHYMRDVSTLLFHLPKGLETHIKCAFGSIGLLCARHPELFVCESGVWRLREEDKKIEAV